MRAKSRVAPDDEDVELDMTPMLDVVFILLIFFIVTAVFVKRPGVDITEPLVTSPEERNPSVLVAVTGEDEVWIDQVAYTPNNIGPVLEGLKSENPRLEIVLQGDNDASIGTVLETQRAITELDIPVFVDTEPN